MTNQQRIVVAVVFVVAVLGGGVLALALTGGGGPGATPSPFAQASPSPEGSASAPASAPASDDPSASAEASPSGEATEEPSEEPAPTDEPTRTAGPTPGPGVPTTVVVTGLTLDAAADPNGVDRRLLFRSRGAGAVTVTVRMLSPQGRATFCLTAGGDKDCTAGDRLTARARGARMDFEVELRGQGSETPEVEVSITFPARNPSLRIVDARFDGTAFPRTNGIQVLLTPRADGEVTLTARWGGHPFSYEVDLVQLDGPGSHVLSDQGPSTGVELALPVTPGSWRLVLQNLDEGFGVTPLEAVIGWP